MTIMHIRHLHSYTSLFVRLLVFNNKIKDMKLLAIASNSVEAQSDGTTIFLLQHFNTDTHTHHLTKTKARSLIGYPRL